MDVQSSPPFSLRLRDPVTVRRCGPHRYCVATRYEGAVQQGPTDEDYLTGKVSSPAPAILSHPGSLWAVRQATPMDQEGVGTRGLATGATGPSMGEQVGATMVGESPSLPH